MKLATQGPLVEAHDIRRAFGPTQALDGVDLAAERGQVLALLGPNGAGKTTLVRILTTLLRQDSGLARIASLDTVTDATRVRSLIGLSGQFAAVDDLLTGYQNLEMIGQLYRLSTAEARSRAADLIERFGLASAAGRLARTYSGGMRRRLDLAASLIARPPVLILDEPTTGLDPSTRLEVWNTVDALAAGGAAVLLTTQYLEEADRLAHRIAVLDHGLVIATGTASQLKDKTGGDLVEVRPGSAGEFDQVVAALRPLAGRLAQDRERLRITIPAPDGATTLRAVLGLLDHAGVAVHDIGVRRPSLDDVFLALTRRAASAAGGAQSSQELGHDRHRRPGRDPRRHHARQHRPRHRHHHPAQSVAYRPHPPAARLHHDPAGAVRAPVRLRLRRRDPHAGHELRRLPAARHLRADRAVRRHHRRGPGHRPHLRDGRPVPVPAHGPLGRPRRAHPRRHLPQHHHPDHRDRGRHAGRLPLPRR